jgi:hypothetical protein
LCQPGIQIVISISAHVVFEEGDQLFDSVSQNTLWNHCASGRRFQKARPISQVGRQVDKNTPRNNSADC